MGTRFHIGSKGLKGALGAYAKRFDLLEVRVDSGEDGRSVPTIATLKRFRKDVPPRFDFAVLSGPHVSRLKSGKNFDGELACAKAAIDVLQARCYVLKTPAEVTPAKIWRDRIAALAESFPRDVTHVVWEPSGVWEIGDAAVFAKKIGIVLAVDASRDPVPAGSVAYVRLRALGETRSFGLSALERVVRAIGERRDAYVVLDTDSALAECKRLREVAQRGAGHGEGGTGRLVRPRGGLLIGDDEQE